MILVGGGSRSGKSAAALALLEAAGPRQGFIATAQALDDEMRDRIEHHRAQRSPRITTWEEPFAITDRIKAVDGQYDAIVVDCLTLWLTNLMLAGEPDLALPCQHLIDAAAEAQTKIILITNEVGCGIVPDNALARSFRDQQGWLNQLAARRAQEVHWMLFGVGIRIK